MTNTNFQKEIVKSLRKIESTKCLGKAEVLEKELPPIRSLHLRDLGLTPSNIKLISDCFHSNEYELEHLASISLSYNQLITDSGIIAFMKKLPKSVSELGLVNCGISDLGGIEILAWMKNNSNLKMICMEQNSFSDSLRNEFKDFSISNPNVLVVY